MTAEHDKPRQPSEGEYDTEAQSETSGTALPESPTRRAFFEYWNQMDMLSWMGARITHSADGHATVYFEPDSHHRGAGVGGRAVTGAVQAYIFDIVTGAAVASLAQGRRPQVTVKLDVTFEHPAYDAPLTFEAQVLGGGNQILFVEGLCHDVNGRVCSRANAIYRRFDRRKEVPESPKKPTPGHDGAEED